MDIWLEGGGLDAHRKNIDSRRSATYVSRWVGSERPIPFQFHRSADMENIRPEFQATFWSLNPAK